MKTRLCRVNLIFVGDEGAQCFLLNASSWKHICTRIPLLLQPSTQAKRMIGALGVPLTVYGELRRWPIVQNGYQYYVNLVVAELRPTVNAIFGMDFLTAYGTKIDLETTWRDCATRLCLAMYRCIAIKHLTTSASFSWRDAAETNLVEGTGGKPAVLYSYGGGACGLANCKPLNSQ